MKYKFFKLIHIAAVALWLGPSTGGYFMIMASHLNNEAAIEMWLRKEYIFLIYFESASFLIIVLSGLGMIRSTNWEILKAQWLRIKLSIIIFSIVPLVFSQIYLYEMVVKRAFMAGIGVEEAIYLYDGFSKTAFLVLFIAIPSVFALAVFKPGKN